MDTSDIILAIVVPIAYIIFRIVTVKKYNKSLNELNIEKYQKISAFKEYIPILIIMIILSAIALVIGLIYNDVNYIGGGIILMIMSFAEVYATYKTSYFYYTDERCVIENKDKTMKTVPYKNIRFVSEKSKVPFTKRHVQMYTGEVKNVSQTAGAIIEEKLNKMAQEKKEKKEAR